jgi:serine/threonine-protein kinase
MAQAVRESRSGELLNESYELHEVLESDGVHDTYRATDRKAGRAVRVKLLRPEFALQSNVVQRFLRAPRTLTGLRHPNVSQVLAVESDETGIPFVVEEHVEGESLARTLERFPDGMPLAFAMQLISKVVEAVAAAHELGVVHGRLDRDHVLITKLAGRSVPKVVRFGASEASRDRGSPGSQRLAPELRDSKATADARSDVWALGALLYEMLCGKPPLASRHMPLGERAPGVPPDLAQLVERCLAVKAGDRPARASAVRDALGAIGAPSRPAAAKAAAPAQVRAQPAAARPARAERKLEPPAPATASPDPLAATAPGDLDEPPAREPSRVAAAKPGEIALSATMIAPSPAKKSAVSQVMEFPVADASDAAGDSDAPVLEISAGGDDDEDGDDAEPEITFEAAAVSLAPRPEQQPASDEKAIKTLSDVAAAFGPIEGADRVGQADVPSTDCAARESGAPARATKAKNKYGKRKDRDKDSDRDRDRDKQKEKERDKVALLPSPKQLKQANAPAKGAVSEEQMRQLRARTQQSERRRGRFVSALLFFLFAFFLLFAIPVLVDPTHTRAQQLLGERANLALGGFVLLSVFALVRTWALQIQARPVMLRPVTITLKVVTALVCVLASTFFLPSGALGPAEVAARKLLPWAGSAFYLFLAMYGLMTGMREASTNALYALAIAVLYSGGFFGSYRVLATTVLLEKDKAAQMAEGGGGARGKGQGEADVGSIANYVAGDLEHDAGAADEVVERNQVGASEADDMRGIDQLEDSRKRKSSQFNDLGKKMDEVIH